MAQAGCHASLRPGPTMTRSRRTVRGSGRRRHQRRKTRRSHRPLRLSLHLSPPRRHRPRRCPQASEPRGCRRERPFTPGPGPTTVVPTGTAKYIGAPIRYRVAAAQGSGACGSNRSVQVTRRSSSPRPGVHHRAASGQGSDRRVRHRDGPGALDERVGSFEEILGGNGPRATPAWHDGRVYALGALGELRSLDAPQVPCLAPQHPDRQRCRKSHWGMSAAPLIVDDKVVVPPGGRRGRSVVAYDSRDRKRPLAGAE